jgi:hypothetical protein
MTTQFKLRHDKATGLIVLMVPDEDWDKQPGHGTVWRDAKLEDLPLQVVVQPAQMTVGS